MPRSCSASWRFPAAGALASLAAGSPAGLAADAATAVYSPATRLLAVSRAALPPAHRASPTLKLAGLHHYLEIVEVTLEPAAE